VKLYKNLIVVLLAGLALPAVALEPLPELPGWSGSVNIGAGYGNVESNFLARISGVDIDLGDDAVGGLGGPDDENIGLPALALDAGYTLKNKKTRLSIGNETSDFILFDRSTKLAVRHDFDGIGSVELAGLISSALQTKVWADPYAVGVSRDDTERSASGGRITWDKIMGSHFEVAATFRSFDIDDESSGEALGLGASERALLDREGDVYRAELGYLADLGGGHVLRPRAVYIDRDLDGDAMAQDGFEVGVAYTRTTANYRWVTDLAYSSLDGDTQNPIFGQINDADRVSFASKLFLPGLFGLQNWTPNIGVLYGEEDSDIDFNDTTVWMVNVSMHRRF
jgi:hypothetical protein